VKIKPPPEFVGGTIGLAEGSRSQIWTIGHQIGHQQRQSTGKILAALQQIKDGRGSAALVAQTRQIGRVCGGKKIGGRRL